MVQTNMLAQAVTAIRPQRAKPVLSEIEGGERSAEGTPGAAP